MDFAINRVDPISLCPNVFHKVKIVLMCMELNETIKTRCRLSFYFPIKGVDPVSLCPIVFPKAQMVLIYMELYQTIRTPERFLCTLNSTWEMISCCCFVMVYVVAVNMDVLTFV